MLHIDNRQKVLGVSSATVEDIDFKGLERIKLFRVPDEVFIQSVSIFSEIEGSEELNLTVYLNDCEVLSYPSDKTTVEINKPSGSGVEFSLKPDRIVEYGRFVVIVNYVEYRINNGFST